MNLIACHWRARRVTGRWGEWRRARIASDSILGKSNARIFRLRVSPSEGEASEEGVFLLPGVKRGVGRDGCVALAE